MPSQILTPTPNKSINRIYPNVLEKCKQSWFCLQPSQAGTQTVQVREVTHYCRAWGFTVQVY